MNIKWSSKAIDGLNLDIGRRNQMKTILRLEAPYELPKAPVSAVEYAVLEELGEVSE